MGFPESDIYEVMALFSLGPHEKVLAHLPFHRSALRNH